MKVIQTTASKWIKAKMKKTMRVILLFAIFSLIAAGHASGVSFDISKSKLDYADMPPGTFKSMTVTLYVRGDKTMTCSITAEDEIKDWFSLNESSPLIYPYTAKTVNVDLRVPKDAVHKSYSSKVYFLISEYSPSASGMGVDVVLRMPVEVIFDVIGNGSIGTYSIYKTEVVGQEDKKIVLSESNNGSRIILLDYLINLSNEQGVIKSLTQKGKIRPYSTRNAELPLDMPNLAEGKYAVDILVTSEGREYAKLKINFTVSPYVAEATATTTLQESTETPEQTSTTMPEQKDYSQIKTYLLVGMLLLINFACIAYLLYKRSRKQ